MRTSRTVGRSSADVREGRASERDGAPGEPRRPDLRARASPALIAFGAAAALVVLAVLGP